jgi:hypothetical protein
MEAEAHLETSWRLATNLVKRCGTGSLQPDYEVKLSLPTGSRASGRTSWSSSGWGGLPSKVRAWTKEEERELSYCLLTELNSKFAFQLDNSPVVRRGCEADEESLLIFMVGASHGVRLSEELRDLGHEVIEVTQPGWRILSGAVDRMAAKLRDAVAAMDGDSRRRIFCYQLWDNSMHGAWSEDRLIPHVKMMDGYHVHGAQRLYSGACQQALFNTCLPILELAGAEQAIYISPLPRYLYRACCGDPTHVNNLGEDGYKEDQKRELEDCRRSLKTFAWAKGLRNITVINPGSTLDRSFAEQDWPRLWEGSNVHPAQVAYRAIGRAIASAAKDVLRKTRKRTSQGTDGQSRKKSRQEDFHGGRNGGRPRDAGPTRGWKRDGRRGNGGGRGRRWN